MTLVRPVQPVARAAPPSFAGEAPLYARSFRRFSWSSYCSGTIGADSANRLHRAIRLSPAIRLDCLEMALDTLARDRDAVRARVKDEAGEPVLHFDVRPRFQRMVVADNDPRTVLSAFVWRPFDFDREGLVRALIAKIGDEDYMALVMHHLVCDAASFPLVWSDLWRNYWAHARGLQPPPSKSTPYGAYLNGLTTWRETPHGQAQIRQLADRLAPHIRGRLSTASAPPAPTPVRIEGEVLAGLRRNAAEARVTLFCMLLAAQAGTLMERYPNQPALIASVHSGRDHPALLETVGYLADRSFYLVECQAWNDPALLIAATWRAIGDVARHRFARFDFVRDQLASDGVDIVTPNFNFAAMPRREPARPRAPAPQGSAPPPIFPVELAPCPVFSGSGTDTCDYALALVETEDALIGTWSPKTLPDAGLADRFMSQLVRLAGLA